MAPIQREMTSEVGLLVVNSRNLSRVSQLLTSAAAAVTSRLYVSISPDTPKDDGVVASIYVYSSKFCPNLDVRVLEKTRLPEKYRLVGDQTPAEAASTSHRYKKVVLGGTFDRLHNGHKVLLSKAAAIASEDVVVGVTDKEMIIKKSLFEMIEPIEKRMAKVVDLVEDVTENVKCLAEPISDPFGPSTRIEDLEAIVVSRETVKGAHAVNKKREEKGMSQLDVVIVELVEGSDEILGETKLSSSTRRREDLGRLLRPPRSVPRGEGRPYVIGLTGGIASGKSHIGKYLAENHGFEVIDCDKLAHTCYEPGTKLIDDIAKAFGSDIVKDGVVDRKKLGPIVFSDKAKLRQLSELVWPVVQKKANDIIDKSTAKVVAVEAAALIEAGWHKELAEVWTVFVPKEEIIRRVMDRDGATEEQALSRMESQISNKERIDESNVVFCSLWKYEETRAQVDLAVKQLGSRI